MCRMSSGRADESQKTVNADFASGPRRSNALSSFAGTWTAEEHRQFEESVASLEEIDAEMWTDNPPL